MDLCIRSRTRTFLVKDLKYRELEALGEQGEEEEESFQAYL